MNKLSPVLAILIISDKMANWVKAGIKDKIPARVKRDVVKSKFSNGSCQKSVHLKLYLDEHFAVDLFWRR
jgi:hypothetical protein